MKPRDYLLCFSSSLIFSYLAVSIPASAQISGDNSLPVPTQVIQQSDKLLEIIGGTEAGINLFHSLAEFSVPEGDIARFINNNSDIQNVIGRVTGGSVSEIFGQIEAGGSAPNFNLFLLNPNGIIFGSNASLNLNGSFVATTANGIQFGDRGFFSASNPNDPSLLTVQPSAFFFNQIGANSITNQSHQTETVSEDSVPVGLQVPNDESLLFLGGDVTIDGGMLTAPNGRVELGGLAATGTVALNIEDNNLSLSFPDGVVRADVLLTNGAKVDVSDRGSGSIAINARNIEIAELSKLASGILENFESSGSEAGDIALQATEKVIIDDSEIGSSVDEGAIGNSGDISIEAESLELVDGAFLFTTVNGRGDSGNIFIDIRNDITLKGRSSGDVPFASEIINQMLDDGEGQGGDIIIDAKSLSLADAASIRANTRGKGNAGNIVIRVDEVVSLENTTDETTQIRTAVEPGAIGNGGTIDIQASSLSLTGGSQLAASVFREVEVEDEDIPGGRGKGGDIIVNASDSVKLSGVGIDGFSSGIFANTERGAEGAAGNITVNTNLFRISDGAVVNALTGNSSSGGNISINANTFEAFGGGQLITTADSSGNAGSITVNATNRVTLSGSDPNFTDREEQFGFIVSNVGADSGLFALSTGTGTAGNITVKTGQMSISEGAQVSVSSPQGQAGNLTIIADSLFLNQGFITAETGNTGGEEGANINLEISNFLIMENESRISAMASGSADGGNIDITAEFIIAFPDQNNDIIAAAARGMGGNINITTNGIFGIAERSSTPTNNTNDIDASSEFGFDGTVNINEFDVNPAEALEELPTEVIDVAGLVARNLCQQGEGSEFTVTGKGGIASSPSQARDVEVSEVDLVAPAFTSSPTPQPLPQPLNLSPDPSTSPPTPLLRGEGSNTGRGEQYRERGAIQGEGSNTGKGEQYEERGAINYSDNDSEDIVQAQGWIVNDRGILELVAHKTALDGSPPQSKSSQICQN